MNKIIKAIKSLKWYEVTMCVVMLAISIYYAIQPQEGTPQWLAIINFVSGLCGIMCIFLAAKAKGMNFPFAIVNTTVFMVYLAYFGIWATFWLEAVVYFPMNIISWVKWSKHKDNGDVYNSVRKTFFIKENSQDNGNSEAFEKIRECKTRDELLAVLVEISRNDMEFWVEDTYRVARNYLRHAMGDPEIHYGFHHDQLSEKEKFECDIEIFLSPPLETF